MKAKYWPCLSVKRCDEAVDYRHLHLEVELMRRRLVVAKAERVDTTQLELEFAAKLRQLDKLAGLEPRTADPELDDEPAARKKKSKAKGRRRLSDLDLPEERIELTDPALEGVAARITTEDMWRRAGYVRLVVARVTYKVGTGDAASLATAEVPRELIFELDRSWRKQSAAEIKALRDAHLRAHTDAFFAWVATEYERVRDQRGLLRTALGYASRQQGPLTRFYDDGRLKLDNNASERELRRIAVGRKNWLFVGSDDHAHAAGNLLTLIASARLHGLDPEAYLRDLFRVLPYWPQGRFLELCPRDWLATRARLDPVELERELGPLVVPELTSASTEQTTSG